MIEQTTKPLRQIDSVVRSDRTATAQRSRWDRTRLQPRRGEWQRCSAASRRHTYAKNSRVDCRSRLESVKWTIEWLDSPAAEAAIPEMYVAFDEDMTIESRRSCPAENRVDTRPSTLCSRRRQSIDRLRNVNPTLTVRRVQNSAVRTRFVKPGGCKRC